MAQQTSDYRLDDVEESFSLTLKDKDGTALKFDVKYPTTEEMRNMVQTSRDLEQMVKDKAPESEIEKRAKESEAELNELITPNGHEFVFSEVLAAQTIRVQRRFREIIEKEFGQN